MVVRHSSNLSIITLLLLLFSCNQIDSNEEKSESKKPKSTDNPTLTSANFSYQSKKKTDHACTSEHCTQISILYPTFKENFRYHSKFNKEIGQKAREILADQVMDGDKSPSMDEMMQQFIAVYQDFKKAFPSASAPWYVKLNIKPTYESEQFASIRYDLESYTGGAHTNASTDFLILNSKGRPVNVNKLGFFVNDKKKASEQAEAIFRKSAGLTAEQSLSKAGYSFSNDRFELTDNIGVTSEGLLFRYNNYEIASHASGPTEIVIPFAMLGDNYKF